jgi:hypothetical protein
MNWLGVTPKDCLKTALKVDLELNPASKAISKMLFFCDLSSKDNLTSSIRNEFM